ncbi:MAG: hypothetical protein ACLP1Q_20365 [Solirubrobacteraceae bacterium]
MHSLRRWGNRLIVAGVIMVGIAESWRTPGTKLAAMPSPNDPGAEEATARAEKEHVLERYIALDTLASAVFQTGMAVAIAGVTIGLTIASRYREIILGGSLLPLAAAILAVSAMVSEDDAAPDPKRLGKKRREVTLATGILIGGVSLILLVFCLLLVLTEGARLLVLLHIVTVPHANNHAGGVHATQRH